MNRVISYLIPLRKLQRLERLITPDHFDRLSKVLLLTSLIVGYAYASEFILAYYSGNLYEYGIFQHRAIGYYKQVIRTYPASAPADRARKRLGELQ